MPQSRHVVIATMPEPTREAIPLMIANGYSNPETPMVGSPVHDTGESLAPFRVRAFA